MHVMDVILGDNGAEGSSLNVTNLKLKFSKYKVDTA